MPSWLQNGLAFVALATAIALAGVTSGQAAGEPKRVVMLHSFGLRFKPWTDNARVVRSEITRKMGGAVDFHDHSLLEARTSDAESEGPFVATFPSSGPPSRKGPVRREPWRFFAAPFTIR